MWRDAHIAGLHPGPPPLNLFEHGGEGEMNTPQPAITSKCTEICGYGTIARFCSKICLAKVYPEGRPQEVVKLYVILDDQSNRSLARTKFFDLQHVKGESSTYTLRTCAGVRKESHRVRHRICSNKGEIANFA